MKKIHFDSLLSVPLEKWADHGVKLRAASIRANGLVTSFSTKDLYGFRVCEFVDNRFTGKEKFDIKAR